MKEYLPRTSINRLNDVDELLSIGDWPVDFVVISSAQVDHYVFISKEEHDGDRIVELIHFVEIRNLRDVDEIDDSEVFYLVGDLVKRLQTPIIIPLPLKCSQRRDHGGQLEPVI